MIGMDREKMRLYNLEDEDIIETLSKKEDVVSRPKVDIDFT